MVHALLLGVAHNQDRRKGIGHSLYYEWIVYYIKIFCLIILIFLNILFCQLFFGFGLLRCRQKGKVALLLFKISLWIDLILDLDHVIYIDFNTNILYI